VSFELDWTQEASSEYDRLREAAEQAAETRRKTGRKKSSEQEGLFKQVYKCVTHLMANPRHPGLETHEYDSLENPYDPNDKVFEAYAQNKTPGAYRVFWCYGPSKGRITIIAITPHP